MTQRYSWKTVVWGWPESNSFTNAEMVIAIIHASRLHHHIGEVNRIVKVCKEFMGFPIQIQKSLKYVNCQNLLEKKLQLVLVGAMYC